MNYSMIAAEGDLKSLKKIADLILQQSSCTIISDPSPAMVMAKHIDPLEKTPFYIGEIFVTQCEVEINGSLGYGCITGNDQERALYAAMIDSVLSGKLSLHNEIIRLLTVEEEKMKDRWAAELAHAAKTKVQFNGKEG